MGYAMLFAECVRCHRPFTSNPNLVPAMRRTPESPKEPICEPCVRAIQAFQREKGLQVWPDPLPRAYDACNEEEL